MIHIMYGLPASGKVHGVKNFFNMKEQEKRIAIGGNKNEINT